MILILDDDSARHRAFKQGLIGAHTHHVTTVTEFCAALQRHAPHIIFLDHDLSDHGTPPEIAGDGLQAARFLAGRSRLAKPLVVIHSLNGVGRMRMAGCLMPAGFRVQIRPEAWADSTFLAQVAALDRDA